MYRIEYHFLINILIFIIFSSSPKENGRGRRHNYFHKIKINWPDIDFYVSLFIYSSLWLCCSVVTLYSYRVSVRLTSPQLFISTLQIDFDIFLMYKISQRHLRTKKLLSCSNLLRKLWLPFLHSIILLETDWIWMNERLNWFKKGNDKSVVCIVK